jgi:hypothetical protein
VAAFIGPCVCGRARFLGSAAPVELVADRVSTVPATRRSGRDIAAKASPWHGQRAKARGAGDDVLWAGGRKVGAASYPAASFRGSSPETSPPVCPGSNARCAVTGTSPKRF